MTSKLQIVLSTVPDLETAERIATAVVEERLAACVNIIPNITSVYRWKDGLEKDSELLLLIKTSEELFESLQQRICTLHPYELPEIVAVSLQNGHTDYINWLESCLAPS